MTGQHAWPVGGYRIRAEGRLFRLERPSVWGRRFMGARSLRVAAWRQNCSATRGAPRSRWGSCAWGSSCARGLAASISAICSAIFWKCFSTGCCCVDPAKTLSHSHTSHRHIQSYALEVPTCLWLGSTTGQAARRHPLRKYLEILQLSVPHATQHAFSPKGKMEKMRDCPDRPHVL